MKTNKFSIGKLIILVGIILVLIGVVYEGISYPWGNMFGEVPSASSMKEPKPLPISYYTFDDNLKAEDLVTKLPASDEKLPLKRPNIDLTFLGTIKIPRIGVSENILVGVDDEILYGVGYQPNTALPGEEGNFVVAGHRNYINMHPFKHLPKMQIDDLVQVEVDGTIYTYKVFKTFEVEPDEVWVTESQPDHESMMTLITCTPIPSYAKRLVVWADLIDTTKI